MLPLKIQTVEQGDRVYSTRSLFSSLRFFPNKDLMLKVLIDTFSSRPTSMQLILLLSFKLPNDKSKIRCIDGGRLKKASMRTSLTSTARASKCRTSTTNTRRQVWELHKQFANRTCFGYCHGDIHYYSLKRYYTAYYSTFSNTFTHSHNIDLKTLGSIKVLQWHSRSGINTRSNLSFL